MVDGREAKSGGEANRHAAAAVAAQPAVIIGKATAHLVVRGRSRAVS